MVRKFRRTVSLTVTSTCINNIYHHYAGAWNVNIICNDIFIGSLNFGHFSGNTETTAQRRDEWDAVDTTPNEKDKKRKKKREKKRLI